AEKELLITSILEAVSQKLARLPVKEYEQLLAKIFLQLNWEKATIYPAIGKVHSTKGAIKLSKKNFKLGEILEINGGFILEDELGRRHDYSFETLVKVKYQEIIRQKLKLELDSLI
ncbi:MAG TPA: hypothetical protein PLQ36_01680, partial [Candidatus Gracilibacteria bacterium]|nr:hypothetical protein [Candidatus Gracilibacteria bacterium]